MEKRPFGKTGHYSSLAIFGSACLDKHPQETSNQAIELSLSVGVNTFDTAPAYGESELRLGAWINQFHQQNGIHAPLPFFLATKNGHRRRGKAHKELEKSLDRLQVEQIDLYQFHSVTTLQELDQITTRGGALEVFSKAKRDGRIRFMGITGHGPDTPAVHRQALERMDLSSVLFSLNPRMMADPQYQQDVLALLEACQERQVAVMVINTTAKGNWGDKPHTYDVWYEPYDDLERVQEAINFALSYNVTGYSTASDIRLLPMLFEACQHFAPQSAAQRAETILRWQNDKPLKFFE